MQNECSVHIIIMAAYLLRGFSDYILLAYFATAIFTFQGLGATEEDPGHRQQYSLVTAQ